MADPPSLADQRSADVKAVCRDVLPKGSRGQRAAELEFPTIEILARVGVDGLIVAAMALAIADRISG